MAHKRHGLTKVLLIATLDLYDDDKVNCRMLLS